MSSLPAPKQNRLIFIDILRGFAVLGIYLFNMTSFAHDDGQGVFFLRYPETIDNWVHLAINFFIQAKFYSLFSFLFGWGMAVQLRRAKERGGRFAPLFARRLAILLLIGLVHAAFIWEGDILTSYALLGFVLLLFRHRSPKLLMAIAGILLLFAALLTMPVASMDALREAFQSVTERIPAIAPESETGIYPQLLAPPLAFLRNSVWVILYAAPQIFAMMLAGLAVGKLGWFEKIGEQDATRWAPGLRRALWVGLGLGIPLNALFVWTIWQNNNAPPAWMPAEWVSAVQIGSRSIGAPALMMGYIAGIILLSFNDKWGQLLTPLAAVGKMALSNYLFQSLISIFIFEKLGLVNHVPPSFALILTLLIFAGQIKFSNWWLERYQFGAMEYLWRSLTYGRRQPLARGVVFETMQPISLRRVWRQNSSLRWWLLGALIILAGWGIRHRLMRPPQIDSDETVANLNAAENPDALIAGIQFNHTLTPQTIPRPTPQTAPLNRANGEAAAAENWLVVADSFTSDSIFAYADQFAASFAHRPAGSPSGSAAADFIARQLANWGAQPAGDGGTFFQHFPIPYVELTESPRLVIINKNGEATAFQFQDEFAVALGANSGAGEAQGELIWANECSRADFAGIDAIEKIAVCRYIQPILAARQALEAGAAGLLLLADHPETRFDNGAIYQSSWLPEPLPTMVISRQAAEAMLAGSELTLADLTLHFAPRALPASAQLSIRANNEVCPDTGCQGRNVLAVLPGSDPTLKDEIIILSAPYDTFAKSLTDGTNSVGVSALLAVAEHWAKEGVNPRRTTLFAAWDAGKHGELGATTYLAQPSYPLTQTIAILNLDGGDVETLMADGNELMDEVIAIAGSLPISVTLTSLENSDHAPFADAKMPAATLNLPSAQLDESARLLNRLLLSLSEAQPTLDALLADQVEAILTNDRARFLNGVAPAHRSDQAAWFDDLAAPRPISLTMEIINPRLMADHAQGTVLLNGAIAGDDGEAVAINSLLLGRFAPDAGGGWHWAGADLQLAGDAGISLRVPPQAVERGAAMLPAINEQYRQIVSRLGLPANPNVTVSLYPSSEALRADTALSLDKSRAIWAGENQLKLTYSNEITNSVALDRGLVWLALADAGISQRQAPWLFDGLPLTLADETSSATIAQPPRLTALIAAGNENTSSATPVAAWAATTYLQNQLGWDGMGTFIQNAGAMGVNAALQNALNVNEADFEQAWRDDWDGKLAEAQSVIDAILAKRQAAILAGDEAAFLGTVDPHVPFLQEEQRDWLAGAAGKLAADTPLTLSGSPVALLDDAGIVAEISAQFNWADGTNSQQTSQILIASAENGWLWAGAPFQQRSGGGVTLFHSPAMPTAQTAQILSQTQQLKIQIAPLLGVNPPPTITLKLYDQPHQFAASIAPDYPETDWLGSWAEAETAIKVVDSPQFEAALAAGIARGLLTEMGAKNEWAMRGATAAILTELAIEPIRGQTLRALAALQRAASRGSVPDWADDSPNWELDKVAGGQNLGLAWDANRYMGAAFGREKLQALWRSPKADIEAALTTELGLDIDQFEAEWLASLQRNHLSEELASVAEAYDAGIAQNHIAALTQPQMGGRLAGSPGGDLAADYIAEQFAELGLMPAFDVSYRQPFTISHAALWNAPRLNLHLADGDAAFVYRVDFGTITPEVVAGGAGTGEIVYVSGDLSALNLSGKVAFVRQGEMPAVDLLTQAEASGAVGLIISRDTTLSRQKDLLAKEAILASSPITGSIPVLALSTAGYNRLLDSLGLTYADIATAPAALPTGVEATLVLPLTTPKIVETANLLAILPGDDPDLRDELVIIGAHYDHVGDDPPSWLCDGEMPASPRQIDDSCEFEPGLRYSGSNDNASGVATLLAIAQSWQEAGVRPKRTVLFAAWGAQESGELGTAAYLAQPLFPITKTVAAFHLDGVGGGDGFRLAVEGEWGVDGGLLLGMEMGETRLDGRLETGLPGEGRLVVPFSDAGIPSLVVSWSEADERNLPDGEGDEVEAARLQIAGELISFSALGAANVR